MKRLGICFGLGLALLAAGCVSENIEDTGSEELIKQLEEHEHVRGALNPFPLVTDPAYLTVSEVDNIREDAMVFICKVGEDVRIFPRSDMYVEVVNTELDGIPVAITYCPITRSGIAWNRLLGADTLLLTASGYLYKENLMPLDVHSGHIWSQMLMRRFTGDVGTGETFSFREMNTFPLIETSWLTVKDHFPDALVFRNAPGMKSAKDTPTDQQLGIIGKDEVQTFSPDLFPDEITLHKSTVQPGGSIVVAGSATYQYILAFRTKYMMEAVEGQFPIIMRDESGTLWNIFGEAVQGDHDGEVLKAPLYYTAADWAWRDLFDQVRHFEP